eukprot:gene10496-8462_t
MQRQASRFVLRNLGLLSLRPEAAQACTSSLPLTRGYNVPIVIESTAKGERAFDIFSRLLKERIVIVNGPIDDHSSNLTVASLLYLESVHPTKPIQMYINSPGGVVTSGLAIYDTMQYIRCPMYTLCVGQWASMASLLLQAHATSSEMCSPGFRTSTPNIVLLARSAVHPLPHYIRCPMYTLRVGQLTGHQK